MSRTVYAAEKVPSLEGFLHSTNGRGRVRVFSKSHYEEFLEHLQHARAAAKACLPYYWEDNAGCVGTSYKYAADTARCGVYSCPPASPEDKEGYVMMFYDRVRAGNNVKCIYNGGRRSYDKWFRSKGGYWFS